MFSGSLWFKSARSLYVIGVAGGLWPPPSSPSGQRGAFESPTDGRIKQAVFGYAAEIRCPVIPAQAEICPAQAEICSGIKKGCLEMLQAAFSAFGHQAAESTDPLS